MAKGTRSSGTNHPIGDSAQLSRNGATRHSLLTKLSRIDRRDDGSAGSKIAPPSKPVRLRNIYTFVFARMSSSATVMKRKLALIDRNSVGSRVIARVKGE